MSQDISSSIEELEKVWTPEARFTIPQRLGETAFLFQAFGPGNYDNVVGQVMANKERGANLPRGEQSAVMLDEVYNSDNPAITGSERSEFVRENIIRNGWLWVPNVNVWTPQDTKNPGMYAVFDENGQGLARTYTIEELEDRLKGADTERGVRFSQDRTVAFAPQNTIRAGYHEKGTLSKDGAFIAGYGVDGSEALDSVAKQFSFKPYSWTVDNDSGELVQTLSALYRYRDLVSDRLDAVFDSYGSGRYGYVISVSGSDSSAEGTAPQN